MENKTYMRLGALFMITAAAIYTLERCVKVIAYATIYANEPGAEAGRLMNDFSMFGSFFTNFFVWFFLLVGFVLLAFGFPARR
ncbi:hypothetical protein [Paenibacillus silvisoli]|uniref:hypothetical protein n=1 Tax=Paenibacillus silvisoli TaxID=3110539 RepID=UPI002804B535|nr:hypothetical protein [Paenibacillus silvisoli]